MKREPAATNENGTGQVGQAPTSPAKCPYCRAVFEKVGFLRNDEVGLITFYHDVPACMKVINLQAIPIQNRIVPPSGVLPRN